MSSLQHVDPDVSRILQQEIKRQNETIDLIASENYPSKAIYEAQNSILTSKYAEGYPHKRYYGGCENADAIEELAVGRLKELYKADYANVQPHSGAQANMAVYLALLKQGDTVMGMKLAHGGHLTHGEKINFSGRLYNFIRYGVSRETERIDYKEVEELALEYKPKLIVAGASAYPRFIDFERFRQIADRVGALFMVDMAHTAGMIAAGLHPSPIPYADVVTSTTHKTLRGPRGGFILARAEYGAAIDSSVFPRTQGGPMMHIIAAKAVCFYEALQPGFAIYQRQVIDNAFTLAESLKKDGLRLVSGGTDTHLILADLTDLNITGRDAEAALVSAGIVANRDPVPYDTRPSLVTSGIRFGTPAVTTRGMGKEEMKQIASLIMKVFRNIDNTNVIGQVRAEVLNICSRFTLPGVSA